MPMYKASFPGEYLPGECLPERYSPWSLREILLAFFLEVSVSGPDWG